MDPIQVGWALDELELEAFYLLSPQAKGCAERLFGNLQDRVIAELESPDMLKENNGHNMEALPRLGENNDWGDQGSTLRNKPLEFDKRFYCDLDAIII